MKQNQQRQEKVELEKDELVELDQFIEARRKQNEALKKMLEKRLPERKKSRSDN